MIVYGSRGSELALTQTKMVAEQVKDRTGEDYRIETLVTTGDRITDRPLAGIGIKGLFTRELEDALRSGSIDAAVHSLKDLPVEDPDGITIGAVPAREAPADVLVARPDALAGDLGPAGLLHALADGARLGTSSPRRQLAATFERASIQTCDIRGNVPTRVDKLRRGEFDAVVLAAAGLNRLGVDLDGLPTERLPYATFTPAPGQGALGVQCRQGDERMLTALRSIHDAATARCVDAERAILLGLGGGCSMPLGALVEPFRGGYRLQATLFGGEPAGALRTAALGEDPGALAAAVVASWKPLVAEPLAGLRVGIVRPDGERSGLAAALAIAGADVRVLPWTTTRGLAPTRAQLEHLLGADGLAFTSARAVRHFTTACADAGLDPRSRCSFAVGEGTATELVALGFEDVRPTTGRGGENLARHCVDGGLATGDSIGMPCAVDRSPGFERHADVAGLEVRALPVYELVAGSDSNETKAAVDAFVFTSPSAVTAFRRRDLDWPERVIAIGRTTADALTEAGRDTVEVLDRPTPAHLVAALTSEARSDA